jgi:hypothetical protein
VSYTETFWEQFPYYLSIGMTEDQYWDGDCALVRSYRKAEELRRKNLNQQAWLQGLYIYDAILRASPILNPLAKKGTQPTPYVEQAYPLTKEEQEKQEAQKEKAREEKVRDYVQAFIQRHNQKY